MRWNGDFFPRPFFIYFLIDENVALTVYTRKEELT
jgi:hypothetical protein